MKKFGVVIVSYDNNLYRQFDSLRNKIFTKYSIPIFTVYNGPGSSIITNESMYIADNEMNPTMYNKFLIGSQYLLNTAWADIDYIVRVNSSTFLNPEILIKTIQTLPENNCYAGVDLFNKLISGMYIIFSKDLLLKIIHNGLAVPENAHSFVNEMFINNHGILDNDDVVIGMLMDKWKINRTILPDPPYYERLKSVEQAEKINYNDLLKGMAVRIKNNYNRKEIDLYMWNKLTELILNQ